MEEVLDTAAVTGFPICPIGSCHRKMQPETSRYHARNISTTGLRCFRCPTCGHLGMVAAGGVQLIFQLVHQYVLTYEPYRATITVLLPAGSIARCHTHKLKLDAAALAKHAAEWALLSGNSSRTISLAPEEQQFLDFTGYLSSLAWPPGSTLLLASHPNVGRTRSEELVRG